MTRPAIWTSIRDTIASEIGSGHVLPGKKLPTEAELSARFGVNRHTVRRALADLAEQGLVESRRGAGVFVARSPVAYPIGRRVRFHQNLRAAGQSPMRTTLYAAARPATERESDALRLAPGSDVIVWKGQNLADGLPIALFRSVFPAERFPDILSVLQETSSVTAGFRAAGIDDYTRATTEINAKLATPTQAHQLGIAAGAPLIRTTSVNIDQDGTPIEYGRAWFSGDHVTLTLQDG
ncbi:MAG: phosphonate metabolism transcriptional regulator PhnF [Pseudomonadota bacterium]